MNKNLPQINDLYQDIEMTSKENDLQVLLNQEPHKSWLKDHPNAKTKGLDGNWHPIKFIPVSRIEWLLTRVFKSWNVEVKQIQILANSVLTTVRLHYKNPIDGQMMYQDGVGAAPIQTDKGSGAIDFNNMKTNAIQLAAPASKSFALKDAAEQIGKLFGKDLNRADQMSYDSMIAQFEPTSRIDLYIEEIIDLYRKMDKPISDKVKDLLNRAKKDNNEVIVFEFLTTIRNAASAK